jgi:hypothetical protein
VLINAHRNLTVTYCKCKENDTSGKIRRGAQLCFWRLSGAPVGFQSALSRLCGHTGCERPVQTRRQSRLWPDCDHEGLCLSLTFTSSDFRESGVFPGGAPASPNAGSSHARPL